MDLVREQERRQFGWRPAAKEFARRARRPSVAIILLGPAAIIAVATIALHAWPALGGVAASLWGAVALVAVLGLWMLVQIVWFRVVGVQEALAPRLQRTRTEDALLLVGTVAVMVLAYLVTRTVVA